MRTKVLSTLFVLMIFFSLMGCDNTNKVLNELNFPETNVSYSQHVQLLFDLKCNYTSCHATGTTTSRLVLTSYYNATRYPGIIVSQNPDNSILNQRMESRLGRPMPPLGDPLPSNFINGVRTWVKEGAKNN